MPGDGGDRLEGLFVAPYGVPCVPTICAARIVRCLALVSALRLVIGSFQYREIDMLTGNVYDGRIGCLRQLQRPPGVGNHLACERDAYPVRRCRDGDRMVRRTS